MGELRIAVYFIAFLTTFVAVVVGIIAVLPMLWKRRRTRIILGAVALVLLIPLFASLFWPARFGPNAPVGQGVTLYVNGADCPFASFLSCYPANRVYGFSGVDGSKRWSVSVPSSQRYAGNLVMVAHNNVLYVAIPPLQNSDAMAAGSGRLMAIRGAAGTILWQINVAFNLSYLVYDNGRLVAYGYDFSNGNEYDALVVDATSGRTLVMRPILQNMTPLAYSDGVIYGCVDIGPNATAQSNSALAAWDVATGKQLWRRPIEACSASHVSAVSRGVLYLNNYGDHGLVAVRGSDGVVLWQALPVSSYADSDIATTAIAVGDGVALVYRPVFISGGHGLYRPTSAAIAHLGAGAPYSTLLAFDTSDGALLWSKTPDATQLPVVGTISPPVIIGSVVLVGGDSLTALRISDGATLWRQTRTQYDVTVIGVSGQVVFTAESYVKPPNSITIEENFTLDYLDAHSLTTGARYWERNQLTDAAISDG